MCHATEWCVFGECGSGRQSTQVGPFWPLSVAIHAASGPPATSDALIGFVRSLPPAHAVGVLQLDCLPESPRGLQGIFVRCNDDATLVDAIEWTRCVRETRTSFPVSVACGPTALPLLEVTAPALGIAPILGIEECVGLAAPEAALSALRARSIEEAVLEGWRFSFGEGIDLNLRISRALIAHGVRGDTVKVAAKSVGLSIRQLGRISHAITGHATVTLLLDARVRGYLELCRQGVPKQVARESVGWFTAAATEKGVARLRRAFERGP
jgi:hypothetical protein